MKHRRRRKELKEKRKAQAPENSNEKSPPVNWQARHGQNRSHQRSPGQDKSQGGGFYTEEIRTGRIRQGFRIVTLDGQEAILAHVSIFSPYQVSKYKVDTDSLNRVGISALRQALKESDLIIIDEIGKMELLSPRFRETVTQAINSGKKVLGTIMLNPHPFADEIKVPR